MKTKTVYLAAPFFNQAELNLVKQVETLAGQFKSIELFSPRSQGILKDMPEAERKQAAKHVFDMNLQHLAYADYVIALLDAKDTGTIWEIGYAYTASKIIGVTTTGAPINIMISECLDYHSPSLESLCNVLHHLDAHGELPPPQTSIASVY